MKYGDIPLVEGKDFEYVYADNTDIGTGKVIIKLIGNYTGEVPYEFSIGQKKLTDDDVTFGAIEAATFCNKAITPEPSISYGDIELVKDVDYTLSYENNINAGDKAMVKVEFIGKYTGNASKSFVINALNVTEDMLKISKIPTQTYTGKAIEPDPNVTVLISEQ